jgi:hypothetical protein
VTAAGALDGAGRLAGWLAARRRRIALAWAGATLATLLALSGGPGISRDEAAVLEAADPSLRAAGAAAFPGPPLAVAPAAAARVALAPFGVSRLRAARLPTAAAGAALSALLAAAAWELAGPAAALLAPALFWAAPRHLPAGLVATPEVLLAALAVALALAWRRATGGPDRRTRARAAALAGVLLGCALAVRADAWALAAALAAHALLVRALRAGPAAGGGAPAAAGRAVATLAAGGALVLVALWPALLWSPEARAAAAATAGRAAAAGRALGALAGGGPLAVAFPLAATALALPATLVVVYAGGTVHAAIRIARALRPDARAGTGDELLLLLLAAAPLAAAAGGVVPPAGGLRPWLHALPFLALLGARALLRAAPLAWPARSAPLAASLALVALWPALRATAHAHPSGASGWSELADGVPGAATLGLPRQDGGESALLLVGAVNARAREGARVWWPTTSPAAVQALALDGRLRADLVVAAAPEDAEIAVVTLDAAGRDAEYRTWAAFRSARPVAGAYLDEVPLALAYARAGAWR